MSYLDNLTWSTFDLSLFLVVMLGGYALKHFFFLKKSSRFRFIALDALFLLLSLAVAGQLLQRAGENTLLTVRQRIEQSIPSYAHAMVQMGHAQIGLDPAESALHYLRLIEVQKTWLATTPEIADIFTLRITDSGILYVVDSEDPRGGDAPPRTDIGARFTKINAGFEALEEAIPMIVMPPEYDEKGNFVIKGWHTLTDEVSGRVDGVLGVIYDARKCLAPLALTRGAILAIVGFFNLMFAAVTGWLALEWALRRREREALLAINRSEERLALYLTQLPLATIAHDFNNILAAIQGHSEMLLYLPDLPKRARDSAEEIGKAIDSAARLTRQLLTLSRGQQGRRDTVDLNALVERNAHMLEPLLGRRVELQLALCSQAKLAGDEVMLEQILINLILNARDAMPNGGVLQISTSTLCIDAQLAAQKPFRKVGEYILLVVKDSGGGIPPEIQARIFEPFFTTKEPGKGTGLGLPSVRSTIQQHGGWIELTSVLQQGTSFQIYFPLLKESPLSPTH